MNYQFRLLALKLIQLRGGKMTQQVNAADDLSSIPRTHKAEEKNRLPKVAL